MDKDLQKEYDEIELKINELLKKRDELHYKSEEAEIKKNIEFFTNLVGKSFWSRKYPSHIYTCSRFNGTCEDGVLMYEIEVNDLHSGKDDNGKNFVYYRVNNIKFYHKDDFDRKYEIGEKKWFDIRLNTIFNNILSDNGILSL